MEAVLVIYGLFAILACGAVAAAVLIVWLFGR